MTILEQKMAEDHHALMTNLLSVLQEQPKTLMPSALTRSAQRTPTEELMSADEVRAVMVAHQRPGENIARFAARIGISDRVLKKYLQLGIGVEISGAARKILDLSGRENRKF